MPIVSRRTTSSPDRVAVRRSGEIEKLSMKGAATEADQDETLQEIVQRGSSSNALADPFQENNLYDVAASGELRIVSPPLNLRTLMRMPMDNSILRQCIEAMVINTEGHGHRLEYIGPDGEDQTEPAKTEKLHIEEFLKTLNPELSLTELRKRLRWDMEVFGFAFIEILRDRQGLPIGMAHVPAHTMRAAAISPDEVSIKFEGMRFGKKVTDDTKRRFRRFVQLIGTKKVWFKEFGDPRAMRPDTGQFENGLAHEETATEVVFLKQYVTGQVYGMPRWINNLVAIQGSRQAELTNLDYFKENAIPAMVVTVAGGFLHDETIQHIEDHVTAARGRAAQNRVMVIEVEGDPKTASKEGVIPAPRIEIKPLGGERPTEGQFLAYDAAQIDKVRSSFRLPPIFTGHAQDYSHASAKTSYEVAEGQVFGPERGVMDDFLNRQVLAPYGVKYWEVRSNPPRISDPDEIISAIEAFDGVGALTPNIAIGLANEQFGLDIKIITEKWGNYPFEIVKQMAAAGRLEGLDEITKEVEAGIDPLTGKPIVQPGATPDPKDDINPDDAPAEKVAKTIRRGLGELSSLMNIQRGAKYQPRARTRPPLKKAA